MNPLRVAFHKCIHSDKEDDMTVTASMLWIIGMALATIAILTIGTLAAADLLPRAGAEPRNEERSVGPEPSADPRDEPRQRAA
jgi:hypothetical protein